MKWYPAPGKLNLFLHVLGKRETGEHAGYHELQTVFRLIDRADRVGIELREDGDIRFSGVYGEDNLCLRAARLLKATTGTALGAGLELEKVLPVGGGLGGGSSDAATVLLVLNRLWNLQLPSGRLLDLGKKLGADVPVFIYGCNALGEGIGERLTALELPAAWYLVLEPQVSVSTKEIFAAALTGQSKALKIPPFFSGQGRNDLEAVVAARYPEVAAHLQWLRQRSPQARMTGSGACVFAEFTSEVQARALYDQLPGDMRGFVARGLDRHPLAES
ncbi:MAG TPA: 4-(cytidine 5'-diphospho)-2-C-methyl-D-erythritol kinase [Burkholderiales bacterium]|jgi:4-diphosphocytidyl-2-C-methyl-D-erythritol kinase|nr:4-(cytidine 5'-diphospho)-2-C-methyl-D-erythritol kinase [Burkholderiales bacterium]